MPKAFDAAAELRILKPILAESGDRHAIDSFNQAARQLRGEDHSPADGYKLITDALHPPDNLANSQPVIDAARDFENIARQFHRRDALTVVIQR
jgi:hypothetical protein